MRRHSLFSSGGRNPNRVTWLLSFVVAMVVVSFALPVLAMRDEVRIELLSFVYQNATLVGITLFGASAFFFASALSNRDVLMDSLLARPFTKLFGRSLIRIVFVCGALIGMSSGAEFTIDGVTRAVYQCGSMGTHSKIDRDGDCSCRDGYTWQDKADSGNFFCVKI
jgi:hypothetical protein